MMKRATINLDMIKDTIEEIDNKYPSVIDVITMSQKISVDEIAESVYNFLEPIQDSEDLLDTDIRRKVILVLLSKYSNIGGVSV
jgi:hypothetical protein